MWILPTRGRPDGLKRLFAAYAKTKASSKGLVVIDEDDPKKDEYLGVVLPENWEMYVNTAKVTLVALHNLIFDMFPNEPWYGLVSDDVVPETDHWDRILIDHANPNGIAYPNDGLRGPLGPSVCVVGGNIVRDLGFLLLPTLKHLYADDCIMVIGKRRRCLKYFPDVMVRHLHFSTGQAVYDDTYKRRQTSGDKEAYEEWLNATRSPLVICCVNAGDYLNRGCEYVNTLFDMVNRNISQKTKYTFTVFTDVTEGYDEGIVIKPLPGNLTGWWNKLYLFKMGLFEPNSTVIFLDLDTLIVGGIDDLFNYYGDFATLRDFWRPEGLGPAVMIWRADGPASAIYDVFEASGYDQSLPRGDQEFIENHSIKPEILQDLYPRQFVSYKTSCQVEIPKDTKVVCFHGLPRPHEAGGWVPFIWKKGGGSVLTQHLECNMNDEELFKNIRHAVDLPFEHLGDQYLGTPDGHVSIVGGGPSLASCLEELKMRQAEGQIIWALNNSFKYLIENGIYPDAHLMVDGRPENAEFVPESTKATLLYSSQCHPEVFVKAQASGGKIIIWHRHIEGILPILRSKGINAGIVGCGSSIGICSIGVAQLFHFKNIHLYGLDSSYDGQNNHAYKQPINDEERVIDVIAGGQSFKCAAWMATQVEDFRACINGFLSTGMEFTVHGYGLLPYVASLLAKT